MTPRERSVATLEGRIPDRIPCVPLVDTSYAAACAGIPVSECFLNPEAYAAALVGRFILSSGCCLGRDTPPENVDAMVRACGDHGACS